MKIERTHRLKLSGASPGGLQAVVPRVWLLIADAKGALALYTVPSSPKQRPREEVQRQFWNVRFLIPFLKLITWLNKAKACEGTRWLRTAKNSKAILRGFPDFATNNP